MMQRGEVSVYVGLGANLGDAQQAVQNASVALANLPFTQLMACSSIYLSLPVDAQGPDFINAVVHLKTRLNAIDLLHACQAMKIALAEIVRTPMPRERLILMFFCLVRQVFTASRCAFRIQE